MIQDSAKLAKAATVLRAAFALPVFLARQLINFPGTLADAIEKFAYAK